MTFPHRLVRICVISVALAVALSTLSVAGATAADPGPSGYFRLAGREAADYQLPADLRSVHTWRDPVSGFTFERYQQFAAPMGAEVNGGQLTVVRRSGEALLVIGAHYPDIGVGGRPLLDRARAIARAGAISPLAARLPVDVRSKLESRARLMIDPSSARLYYLVEMGAPGVHLFHEIDAGTGALLAAWDAIDRANGMGTGAKGDRKSLLGDDALSASDNLTRWHNGAWRMQSVDGRILTLDGRGSWDYQSGLALMSDKAKPAWNNDNDWMAAYQRPAVDAQYYSRLTDDYLRDPSRFGFDLLDGCDYGAIRNVVHYDEFPRDGFGYDNAFWDGWSHYFVYGDGDGIATGPFTGAQDVVTHEMTHAVTQCRAELKYQGMSGALNEGFSDIIAAAAEWHFDEPLTSNCRRETGQASCADWWVGEDAIRRGAPFGFRSLADPALADLPSHWADRFTQSWDNGGVHINAGIPSHAFYLMVAGGRNARCAGPTDTQADCDVVVPSIPLADAERIAFAAWGMLTYQANFCEARNATVAAAELLFPDSDVHLASADLSWAAVGRRATNCEPTGAFSINLSRRSVAVAPGGSGQLSLALTRGTQAGPINFGAAGAAPATISLSPDGTVVTLGVPAGMPSGVFPFVVTASDGTVTRQVPAVLVVDSEAPTGDVSQPQINPTGVVSTGGQVPLRVSWSVSDEGSGVTSAALEASADGGPWTAVGAGGAGGTASLSAAAAAYALRVTGTDAAGNSGVSGTSGPWEIGRWQEGSASYSRGWSSMPSSQGWGSVRFSKVAGASATFSFEGSDVAWISTRGPKRGRAKIYVDGSFVLKVDLYAARPSERRIVFVATGLTDGPHTLRVVVAGTSGRPRVDIDGFVVLDH